MKKYLLFLMAIMLATVARAADGDTFTFEGLNYKILSEADHTAEVGKNDNASGEITIPYFATRGSSRYIVTSIGDHAFYVSFGTNSKLTSVTIPNSVTSIGHGPFAGCTNLNEIIVEAGNEKYCSDNGVLYDYKKTSLIQCPGAKKEIEISNSVTLIGACAFYGCSGLTSVIIPSSVTSIGYEAFRNCSSLPSVTIPNSVTSISWGAFEDCSSLISVTIPNSVTRIGGDVFFGCSSLTSVTIPSSVISIEYSAFRGCSSLRTIIDLNPTPQGVDTRENYLSFKGVPSDAVVYIPKGSYMTYMLADGWTQFSDFREMGTFDVTISASTLELAKDETAELTVTVVKDDDVIVGDHEWVSFNPEVATVENGKVTAVAPGTTTINYTEYTIIDGIAVPHTVACEVTVTETTGIRDIVEEDDAAAPADVFNLQGVQVLRNATESEINALPAGIYIVRQGRKAKKIAVK